MLRAIQLERFNIFDLDSYNSPWEQAMIIADRRRVRPGELIGIVFTDGSGKTFIANQVPRVIRALTGLRQGTQGMLRNRRGVMDKCIAGVAQRMHCEVVKRWQAHGKTGASVYYVGLILRGIADR